MPAALAVLDVIADPTRRRILDTVRQGERSVGELVDVRRDAQRRLYRLRPEPLMELDEWLEPFRREWVGRLDALERHLERTTAPIRTATKEPT